MKLFAGDVWLALMFLYQSAYVMWMLFKNGLPETYYEVFWREVFKKPPPAFWFYFDLLLTTAGAVLCLLVLEEYVHRGFAAIPAIALLIWPWKYIPRHNRHVPHWPLDLAATLFGVPRLLLLALGVWP